MKENSTYQEGKQMLLFLRALGTEEQCIAYALLEGMRLQKRIEERRTPQPQSVHSSA